MPRYLMTCECGKLLPVEVGQAGGHIVCACGATLDVPTLRRLIHLPTEPNAPPATASWTARHGAIAAGLILAGLLAAASLWIRLTEPRAVPFDPVDRRQLVDERIKTLTPAEAWNLWIVHYRPLAEYGFSEIDTRLTVAEELEVARKRRLEIVVLALAGMCAAAAVGVACWPAKKSRRQGEMEKRKKR